MSRPRTEPAAPPLKAHNCTAPSNPNRYLTPLPQIETLACPVRVRLAKESVRSAEEAVKMVLDADQDDDDLVSKLKDKQVWPCLQWSTPDPRPSPTQLPTPLPRLSTPS